MLNVGSNKTVTVTGLQPGTELQVLKDKGQKLIDLVPTYSYTSDSKVLYSDTHISDIGLAVVFVATVWFAGPSGYAAAAGNAVGAGAVTTAMATAATTALFSQFMTAMVDTGGNLRESLNRLDNADNLRQTAVSSLTAGALSYVGSIPLGESGIKLNDISLANGSKLNELLGKNLINAAVSAAVESAATGESFDAVLERSAMLALLKTGAAGAAFAIGGSGLTPDMKLALHAALGCVAGALKQGGSAGCTPGALGAVAAEAFANANGDQIRASSASTEEADKKILEQASLVATVVGCATGGSAGCGTGGFTGANAVENNYLTSADLINREKRLKAARDSGDVELELKILKEFDAISAKNTGAINYNSVLTESSLQADKAQLEQLLKDPKISAETKAQAQRSINELNTVINVIQKSPVLKDAAELGLIAVDVLTLGQMAVAKTLTTAVVKEFIAAKTGKVITDDAAAAISNNFYRDGDDLYAQYKNSNGGWNWPPNAGAVSGTERAVTLKPGDTFDRYGSTTGNYVAPTGTPIGERALAPGSAGNSFAKYEVLKPLPDAIQSQVAPAFGQVGGGVQIELKNSIQWYLDNGYIKGVK